MTRRRPARPPAALLALLITGGALAAAPAGAADPVRPYRDGDRSVTARNILPPGQGRYLNGAELALSQALGIQPEANTNQLGLYEDLVAAAPTFDASDLMTLYKDSSFGVPPGEVGRTYSPAPGTTVVRDRTWDVPHVYGSTREATFFGAGYVSGEDRLFMMDILRHLARGRLSEFLGASPDNLAADRAQRAVADYTEEELEAMGLRLLELDPDLGARAQADLDAFVAGVNAYIDEALLDPTRLPADYPALQQVPRPWKATDSIALATLIGGQFSVGGGGQILNEAFLSALEQAHDPATARAIFDDFRFANDPEAPVSTTEVFPFNDTLPAPDPAAVARPDDAAVVLSSMARMPASVDGPRGPIALFAPEGGSSNALLVNASHSETGRPLTVFGPQVGYFSPQILMEIGLYGPGIAARGATFPGLSLYVLLGRGRDYAWSATTAIGDHIDIRAVRLCEPNGSPPRLTSTHYLRDGDCLPIHRRTDQWVAKPSAGGIPEPLQGPGAVLVSMTTERVQLGDPDGRAAGLGDLPIGPDWAIVSGRGTVDSEPVAFVLQRSSYGIELDSALTFNAIHEPEAIDGVDDLIDAFGWFTYSFNWHLADGEKAAFFTTGRYPTLAAGVDPDLPFWGDSAWDWTGFLPSAEHPQGVDPALGYIPNWNNKQAPGFRASDNWFAYGPVGRVQSLIDGIEDALAAGGGQVNLVDVARVVAVAGTVDVRGRYVLPWMLDVIGTPADPDLADAVALLEAWVADGAHRRDLSGDRRYEHAAAAALMDAMWTPALAEVFAPTLGSSGFRSVPLIHDGAAGPGGSAYLSGWYGHLQKDLRKVLGEPVAGAFSRTYCGDGVLADCREALLSALTQARQAVVDGDGADPADWGADLWERDAIRFAAVGVQGQRAMHWQNRPTFQQVLEFLPPPA